MRLIFWLLRKMGIDKDLDVNCLNAFEYPLRILLVFLGVYLALRYIQLPLQYDRAMAKLLRSLVVLSLAWGLCRLMGSERFLSSELTQKLNIDSILLPFLSKAGRFIIVALAFVLIAHEWDYDVNGFIAGLGLGGLAFALAAKDALANIFGGIIIVVEKPFSINDWVQTPSVEGEVQNISFRSTRFRTAGQALVTVPNSTLANEPITNWSRMGKKKLDFYIGLTYNTTCDQMEKVIKRIEKMLHEHPDIHPDEILVNFENFNDSSLDILIYCFTKTTVRSEYLKVRQNVNLKIMQILEEENVSMAFPSRSLFVENMLKTIDAENK
ncbi:MAG TPA: mechanosensitive ion channel family protein [Syntrophomonadaceae bacterium]|nr:mechanosensitive ion channel family protein [Syntrophomonadaceae bacterium]